MKVWDWVGIKLMTPGPAGRSLQYQEKYAHQSCLVALTLSLMRGFEQTEISIDAQDHQDVRKQRQDKTVNGHSHIVANGSSR